MRIHRTIASALAASAGFAAYSDAFAPTVVSTRSSLAATVAGPARTAQVPVPVPVPAPLWSTTDSETQSLSQADADAEPAPCDMPSDVEEAVLDSAAALRSAALTNAKGETVVLGDMLRENTSNVVVFLRHMGWPYCWTYANDWEDVREQLARNNVGGPIFVSIGDAEKLGAFLEQNPAIDPSSMLVDGYGFDAYEAAGFGKFTDVDPETAKQVDMQAPGLGFGQWMGYFRAVGKVSPIPKDMKFGQIPEGVLRLGGTFVVKNDEILYQWSDRLPGDHPDLAEVVSIAVAGAGK